METLYDAGDALDLVETKRFSATLETGPFVRSGPALNRCGRRGSMDILGQTCFIEDFLGDAGTLGIAADQLWALQGSPARAWWRWRGTATSTARSTSWARPWPTRWAGAVSPRGRGDSFDVLSDTVQCNVETYDADGDGEVTAEECVDADGTNFMFWTSGDVTQIDVSRASSC